MTNLSTYIFLTLMLVYQNLNSQNPKESYINEVQRLANDIGVDTNYRNGDWKPVIQATKQKEIILLGEMNHGSREIFVTRADLIKALHRNLGIEAILFESGIGEVGAIQLKGEDLLPEQMVNGFFGGWRTNEFKELMSYIKENDLSIAGFDVQKTGGSFYILLKEVVSQNEIDTAFYLHIEQKFNQQKRLLTRRDAVYETVKQSTQDLIQDYQILLKEITKNLDSKSKPNLLVQRTLSNRIAYLKYYLEFTRTRDWNQRWEDRDSMMAANVEWLIDTFYPNKKVIVVAHNFHIAKSNKKENVMGEFLLKKYGSKMYSLGVFAGSGSYADNSGKEKPLKESEEHNRDLKNIILSLNGKVHFIDMPKEKTGKNTFLFEELIVNDTFIDLFGSNTLTLSDQFDGLLFIDKISPPEK